MKEGFAKVPGWYEGPCTDMQQCIVAEVTRVEKEMDPFAKFVEELRYHDYNVRPFESSKRAPGTMSNKQKKRLRYAQRLLTLGSTRLAMLATIAIVVAEAAQQKMPSGQDVPQQCGVQAQSQQCTAVVPTPDQCTAVLDTPDQGTAVPNSADQCTAVSNIPEV